MFIFEVIMTVKKESGFFRRGFGYIGKAAGDDERVAGVIPHKFRRDLARGLERGFKAHRAVVAYFSERTGKVDPVDFAGGGSGVQIVSAVVVVYVQKLQSAAELSHGFGGVDGVDEHMSGVQTPDEVVRFRAVDIGYHVLGS